MTSAMPHEQMQQLIAHIENKASKQQIEMMHQGKIFQTRDV